MPSSSSVSSRRGQPITQTDSDGGSLTFEVLQMRCPLREDQRALIARNFDETNEFFGFGRIAIVALGHLFPELSLIHIGWQINGVLELERFAAPIQVMSECSLKSAAR